MAIPFMILALWVCVILRQFFVGCRVRALLAFAPHATFIVLWALYWDWHVDDAGIAYAYARNAAEGYGLRPYVESSPVEGFSNPGYVLLLAVAELVGVAAPTASKALGLVLGVATIEGVRRITLSLRLPQLAQDTTTAVLASNASFVVWMAGGLENPLLAAGLVGVCAIALRRPETLLAGALAGVVGLTRPEGPLLAAAVLGSLELLAPYPRLHRLLRNGAIAAGAVAVYLFFRVTYFGDLSPNTFYAKIQAPLSARLQAGLIYVVVAFASFSWPVVLYGGLGGLTVKATQRHAVAFALPILAGIAFALYSAGDWMSHSRFFSHLVPLVVLIAVPGLFAVAGLLGRAVPGATRLGVVAALLVCAGGSVSQAAAFETARRRPTLSLSAVQRFGAAFEAVVTSGCGPDATLSVASPDVGGLLWRFPHMQLTDLAALTDREAARESDDPMYWRTRLAGPAAPALVFTHGIWTQRTGLVAPAMDALGYDRVCERSADATTDGWERRYPASVYLTRECAAPLSGHALQLLVEICGDGASARGYGDGRTSTSEQR